MKNYLLATAVTVLLSGAAVSAQASAFNFVYHDTISDSEISGIAAGQAAKITVSLDNGGSSLNNQTWTAAHLQSVTFDFNNGAFLTTFSSPWGGNGLDSAIGSFTTNSSGALTGVMNAWEELDPGSNYTTNFITPTLWFLNGGNGIILNDNYDDIQLTNVSSMLNPASWTYEPASSSVPVPATVWLLAVGLIGLVRRKQA